jgi:hypothetical protein
LATHARQSSGIVKPSDFHTARDTYEQALFRTMLDASSPHE